MKKIHLQRSDRGVDLLRRLERSGGIGNHIFAGGKTSCVLIGNKAYGTGMTSRIGTALLTDGTVWATREMGLDPLQRDPVRDLIVTYKKLDSVPGPERVYTGILPRRFLPLAVNK